MFELKFAVNEALCLVDELDVSPRYVYENNKRTDEQETRDGKKLWRVKGLAPIVEVNGKSAIDTDATVVMASASEPDVSGVGSLGEKLQVTGDFSVTRVQYGEASGRLDLETIGSSSAVSASFTPRHGDDD